MTEESVVEKTTKIKKGPRGPQEGYHPQNLAFLDDFLRVNHISTGDAAQALGVTRQVVYYWLKKDDIRLSSVLALFEKLGHRLKIELEGENQMSGKAWVRYDPPKNDACPRLSFLTFAFDKYNIKVKDLHEKTGISVNAIYHWLEVDDILVSYIYKVAEAMGLQVVITIEKI